MVLANWRLVAEWFEIHNKQYIINMGFPQQTNNKMKKVFLTAFAAAAFAFGMVSCNNSNNAPEATTDTVEACEHQCHHECEHNCICADTLCAQNHCEGCTNEECCKKECCKDGQKECCKDGQKECCKEGKNECSKECTK